MKKILLLLAGRGSPGPFPGQGRERGRTLREIVAGVEEPAAVPSTPSRYNSFSRTLRPGVARGWLVATPGDHGNRTTYRLAPAGVEVARRVRRELEALVAEFAPFLPESGPRGHNYPTFPRIPNYPTFLAGSPRGPKVPYFPAGPNSAPTAETGPTQNIIDARGDLYSCPKVAYFLA